MVAGGHFVKRILKKCVLIGNDKKSDQSGRRLPFSNKQEAYRPDSSAIYN